MKNKDININLDLKHLGPQLLAATQKLSRYVGMFFFLLVAGVYGFVLFRISTLNNIQPSGDDVSAQAAATSIPKVDPKIVKQLETLKDNSVNVQTLFDEARQNPFQE